MENQEEGECTLFIAVEIYITSAVLFLICNFLGIDSHLDDEKTDSQMDQVSLLRPRFVPTPSSSATEKYSLACLWAEIK